MKGKLFIIEGSDSSGKATQTEKLYNKLVEDGYKIKMVEYPNYKSESSALVKMYLRGDFGKKPNDVNPYVASTFYAGDRYASFKLEWEEFYNEGGIIIADRYTTSNMIHQAAKMEGEEKDKFLNWLWDFEFNMYKLPIPDSVIFLNMPPEFSEKLMAERANKITGEMEKDIHERDKEYLINSYNNSLYIADKYKWNKVSCTLGEKIKTIDEIHHDVYMIIKELL